MKRRFIVTVTRWATIEIDDKVIKAVDDEWRSHFYDLQTPEDIAAHVGSNLLLGAELTQLDGFADLKDKMAQIVPGTLESDVTVEVDES